MCRDESTNLNQSINPEYGVCIEEDKDLFENCPITQITFNTNVRNL